MAITKVGPKYQVTIPKAARDAVQLKVGDFVDIERKGNKLVLIPKRLVEKHPEIDRRLAEAEEDIKAGRVYGPFNSVEAMLRSLHKGKPVRKSKRSPRS